MKQIILGALLFFAVQSNAQTLDSIALGNQYVNESYYSFANGEVANVNNANWDLAFDLSAYGATIRMNGRTDVLYLYPGATSDWSTLDTAGHLSWSKYINGDEHWTEGALNAPANTSVPEDLGWGLYNTITHAINGSRLFVIKLSDASYRKLYIEQLAGGAYTFKYANIDGSNEIHESITKSIYAGKNFIHYSILNEQVVDREPLSASWDIVFTNYIKELAPGYFGGVTGVLSNSTFRNLTTAESSDVPVGDAIFNSSNLQEEINVIGYDWKTFNMGTFTYEIEDSLCYFVRDENDNVWKLVLTGFAGSSTGKIYFTKEQITFASTNQIDKTNSLNVFPNPASAYITIAADNLKTISIFTIAGQLVMTKNVENENQLTTLSTEGLENGLYILQSTLLNNEVITTKIIIKN